MQLFQKINLILIFTTNAKIVSCVSVDKDLSITWDQKVALDKFRESVGPYLPHDYMREDIYLIRWLRARNFDIRDAESMLKKNVVWRRENKIDKIHEEDFSDLELDYKFYNEGFDYEGRPVSFWDLGAYDLRRAALTGMLPKLHRYLYRYMEEITTKVRTLREIEGRNITQYSCVVNMDGFNIVQHVCLQCLPFVLDYVTTYENYYPGAADKVYLVNTPAAFEPVLQVLKNVMRPQTRDSLEVYGTNKAKWQPILFSDIPRDQLPRQVGGLAKYGD